MENNLSPAMHRAYESLRALYGDDAVYCLKRLQMMVGRYGLGLDELPKPRVPNEEEIVLITYGDTVRNETEPPLRTLGRFLDTHLEDVISTVHILPFFPYSSDDGFSVIDYRQVRPDLGTWRDIQQIGQHFDLMFDLVLNHCSRASGWFRGYAAGAAPWRHYFVEADPSEDLSAVVRPRSHPLLTPTQTRLGERHVWTTFSADQVDLDFKNPDVLFEFLDILYFYILNGARVIRLDAIAYLWKEIGSSSIHLPQTHQVVKLLRNVCELVAPDVLILTETNVPHEENISYFGDGDEAQMVYQFSLPPLLVHGLLFGEVKHLRSWAASLSTPPEGASYLNFTASHDGIGLRPLEGIVAAGQLTELVEKIQERGGQLSMKRNSDGSESVYEMNIAYFDALGDPSSPGSPIHIERFLCSQTVAMELQGVPAIYLHSLTATRNDLEGLRRSGRNRSINRKQWDSAEIDALLDNPQSVSGRVFREYLRRLRIRRAHPAFHPRAEQIVHDVGPRVFALERVARDKAERVLCLNNFSDREQRVPLTSALSAYQRSAKNLLAKRAQTKRATRSPFVLKPYQSAWLVV